MYEMERATLTGYFHRSKSQFYPSQKETNANLAKVCKTRSTHDILYSLCVDHRIIDDRMEKSLFVFISK